MLHILPILHVSLDYSQVCDYMLAYSRFGQSPNQYSTLFATHTPFAACAQAWHVVAQADAMSTMTGVERMFYGGPSKM
jgi:hypothetical protein